jgi:hypothetical protein
MKLDEFVDQLFGLFGQQSNDTKLKSGAVRSFIDRLLLRLFNSHILISYLKKVGLAERDGKNYLQVVFSAVPNEVIPDIQRVIAVDGTKIVRYSEDSQPYVAFEIPIDPTQFVEDPAALRKMDPNVVGLAGAATY